MHPRTLPRTALAVLLLSAPLAAAGSGEVEWNARNAEHLLNRAGFGARPPEIERAVATGHAAFVDELLRGWGESEPFHLDAPQRPARGDMMGMDEEERRMAGAEVRREERQVMVDFAAWWIDAMLGGPHPLRERMTLFWHGHFPTSYQDIKDSVAIVEQNELFRRHALGSFRELLHAVVRDPAMLQYLDGDKNQKGSPNENLARELMELFTLGEGHYGEQDVQEAARALTGWRYRPGMAQAIFVPRQHDGGEKTILGRTRRFDAAGLVDLLLEQEQCPRWLAGKLLVYFEGREPGEERLAHFAGLLREHDYQIAPFLSALFLHPGFYSDGVVGRRISGPIDYLVGSARRLGVDPPAVALWHAAGQNGQRLFVPPNVKGWDGGKAWITTANLLQRGNFAGMLLGVVRLDDVMAPEPMDDGAGEPSMEGAPAEGEEPGMGREGRPVVGREAGIVGRLLGRQYRPEINLTARCRRAGALGDEAIVETLADELLAVPLSAQSRALLVDFLRKGRSELGAQERELLEAPREAEDLLRRLAHLILSLPEAQLG